MKKSKKPKFPIDIPLSDLTLEGGAVFVTLRTLDELESFWNKHREALPFAVQGIEYGEKQHYLNPYEWIFAPTKAAVVKAVFRWDQMGIKCEWYDWATESPEDHSTWFHDQASMREKKIAKNAWSESDEKYYQEYTPDSYRGWWRLTNLPNNINEYDWFSPFGYEEIIDPNLPIEVVSKMLQEQTFDDWKESDSGEVKFEDKESMDREIAYWREEQRNGQDYYGQENEEQYKFALSVNGQEFVTGDKESIGMIFNKLSGMIFVLFHKSNLNENNNPSTEHKVWIESMEAKYGVVLPQNGEIQVLSHDGMLLKNGNIGDMTTNITESDFPVGNPALNSAISARGGRLTVSATGAAIFPMSLLTCLLDEK